MQMNILGSPLAMVEFSFLEQHKSVEGWNNSLFEIFQWLDEMENTLLQHQELQVILLNDEQIFFKKRGEKKIGIYKNSFSLKPKVGKQLIVTCSENEKSNQVKDLITTFTESLLKFLEEKKIKNQVLSKSSTASLGGSLAVEQMVEVFIGVTR